MLALPRPGRKNGPGNEGERIMTSLTGKIAWVTGAGTGIGEAAAIALAAEGATLVLTGRRREPLDSGASRIRAAGGAAEVQPGDMMVSATVADIGSHIQKTFGRLDILVANAGLNVR